MQWRRWWCLCCWCHALNALISDNNVVSKQKSQPYTIHIVYNIQVRTSAQQCFWTAYADVATTVLYCNIAYEHNFVINSIFLFACSIFYFTLCLSEKKNKSLMSSLSGRKQCFYESLSDNRNIALFHLQHHMPSWRKKLYIHYTHYTIHQLYFNSSHPRVSLKCALCFQTKHRLKIKTCKDHKLNSAKI